VIEPATRSAHLVSVVAFGVVSIVMTIYFVCVGIARAIVGDPLMFVEGPAEGASVVS
jgi:hypothetical protein